MARVERRVLLEYDEDFLALPPDEQARIRKLEKERKAKGTISLAEAKARTRELMSEINE